MKYFNILILGFILSFSLNSFGQTASKKIINQMKRTANYEGLSVPGWVISLGSKFVNKGNNTGDLDNWQNIFKGIKHINIATTTLDLKKYNTKAIINSFAKNINDDEGLDEYISVRSEDQNLKILIDEQSDVINEMIIMSAEGGEIAFLQFKTNLKLKDLKSFRFNELANKTLLNN